jgi:transcriptional regulator with XRE-family HTH domain
VNFSSHCPPRIKEERLRLGLSQAQVAEKTGVSREMWGRYERGDAIPGGEVLFSFAGIGADIQYVMTGESSSNIPAPSVREMNLLRCFKCMAEEDRNAIERLILTVSKSENLM